MGWLFSESWPTRKDLIRHLTEGNGVKTLKHCTVGNNLWCLHEYENYRYPGNTIKYVCLYKMAYHGKDLKGWGYKGIDETMGPVELSCPASYLDMCTAPEGNYAYDWRQRVYERDRKLKQMKIGTKVKYGENTYQIVKRRSPSSWLVKMFSNISGEFIETYRAGARWLLACEVVA
jgi:hypothetical protein